MSAVWFTRVLKPAVMLLRTFVMVQGAPGPWYRSFSLMSLGSVPLTPTDSVGDFSS